MSPNASFPVGILLFADAPKGPQETPLFAVEMHRNLGENIKTASTSHLFSRCFQRRFFVQHECTFLSGKTRIPASAESRSGNVVIYVWNSCDFCKSCEILLIPPTFSRRFQRGFHCSRIVSLTVGKHTFRSSWNRALTILKIRVQNHPLRPP